MAQQTAVVNLKINNTDAKKRVEELTQLMGELKKKSSEATTKGDTKGLKEIKSQIKAVNDELKEQKLFATDVDNVLKNINKAKMTDVYNSLKILRGEILGMNTGSKEYLDTIRKIKDLEAKVAQHRKATLGTGAKMFESFNKMLTVTGVVAVGNKLKSYADQCIVAFNSMSDSLANARKSTGLTQEQVESLNKSLSKIDTRTSQEELLGLAYQAGKLGETGEKNILKFVDAADKIGVALGDDLGGKDEAINQMGKLVDLFKIKDEYGLAEGMLKVGSAVNALGAASTANEGYIVNFTSRIGGISAKSKIAISDSMGLAATFDSLNARSEASATVINKLIIGMFSKTSEYAKVAKMDVKSFSDLIKTDANEALLKLLEGLNGPDVGVTTKLLRDMGETGSDAANAIALISSNIGMVREQQEIARKEFEKGTGVFDEFNIKNTTAAADREKQLKNFQETLVEVGSKLSPLYNDFLAGTATAAKMLGGFISIMWQYRGVLVSIGGAIAAYKGYMLAAVAVQKLKVFWSVTNRKALLDESIAMLGHSKSVAAGTATTATYTLGQKALAVVNALVSGSFKAAGTAAKSFFVALGPIGWAITAIGALGAVIAGVTSRTDSLTKSKEKLNEVQSDVESVKTSTETFENQRSKISDLIKTYNDLSVKTDRTGGENKTLQDTIDLLAKAFPGAIKGVDAYGKAVDISTGKVLEAVEAERQFLIFKNKKIIDNAVEDAGDVVHNISSISSDLSDNSSVLKKVSGQGYKMSRGGKAEVNAKNRQTELSQRLKSEEQLLYGFVLELEKLQLNTRDIARKLSDETGMMFSAESIEALKWRFEQVQEISSNPTTPDAPCEKCGKTTDCKCYQGGEVEKGKWTLENDLAFGKTRIGLKQDLLNGVIKTESVYNEQLLAAEIVTLESRISLGKEKGEDLLKLQQDLADRKYSVLKKSQQREAELAAVIIGNDPIAQEEKRHQDKLESLGLHNKMIHEMTAKELDALLVLESDHERKLSSLHTQAIIKEYDLKSNEHKRSLTKLKIDQGQELAGLDTFEKKKAFLKGKYSETELAQIKTSKEADKAIKAHYQKKEAEQQKKHLEDMIKMYTDLTAEWDKSGTMSGKIVSDEDVAKMKQVIDDLKAKLAELGVNIDFTAGGESGNGVDVLGMTPDKWAGMFKNLEEGKIGMEEIAAVANAIGSAFSDVSNLMSAMEQKELKTYEKTQDTKKKALQRQLDSGVISQENYNSQVQRIDDETESKRVEMERKQAERQKALAIFQAIVSTAVAVTSALGAQPYGAWNIALAAIVGALGAVQIATIAAQPLPGAEDGGLVVERQQDGKMFNAGFDPKKRGKVDKPTVIVGENGSEYVVPTEGYANPTIRPVLGLLESARKDGSLRNIDFVKSIAPLVEGRQSGGFVDRQAKIDHSAAKVPFIASSDRELLDLLLQNKEALALLTSCLSHPLIAYIALTGKGGLEEANKQLSKIRNNGKL